MATPPPPIFQVQPGVSNELQVVLHVAADFFADTLPGIFYIAAIVGVAILFTVIVTKLVRCLFIRCAGPSMTQVVQYVLAIPVLWTGFIIAYGAVGVDFNSMFLGASIFAAAVVVSAGDFTKDFVCGVQLLFFRVLDNHKKVELRALGVRGEIISIGLFTAEIVRDDDDDGRRPTTSVPGERGAAEHVTDNATDTVFVANRLILAEPFDVVWRDDATRSTVRGKPSTVARRAVEARSPQQPAAPTTTTTTRFSTRDSMTAERQAYARQYMEQESALTPAMMTSLLLHRRTGGGGASFGV